MNKNYLLGSMMGIAIVCLHVSINAAQKNAQARLEVVVPFSYLKTAGSPKGLGCGLAGSTAALCLSGWPRKLVPGTHLAAGFAVGNTAYTMVQWRKDQQAKETRLRELVAQHNARIAKRAAKGPKVPCAQRVQEAVAAQGAIIARLTLDLRDSKVQEGGSVCPQLLAKFAAFEKSYKKDMRTVVRELQRDESPVSVDDHLVPGNVQPEDQDEVMC